MYQDKPSLDELMHYGMPRRSGRYPWGSGEDPYQHTGDFLARVQELKKEGMSESEIAKALGIVNEKGEPSSTKLRARLSLATAEKKQYDVARIKSLKEDGLSGKEIEKITGIPESTQRSLLNAKSVARRNQAIETAEFLKKQIEEKGMLDVGTGVERELNISKEKLNQALEILKEEGYPVYGGRVPQATNPGKLTTLKVLCPQGTEHKEIYEYGEINSVMDYISRDNGVTYEKKFNYPESMDSSRLMIRYADDVGADGARGIDKDGVIELRRGVADLSLGESRYSQVRILVDGTHYLKGMAVYSDDMPDGVDVVFNTNKTKDKPMMEVLKKIKSDPDNPFGSAIKDADKGGQYFYDPKTGERVSASHPNAKLGLINKRADEGDWSDWKDKLPSQFLSKQTLDLAKKQLNLAITDKKLEYESICELTNPTVKKRLLQSFADDCDSAAVHLQAAALPRQKYHVILPVNSLKDNEVYAPNYKNGEQVALIRYPHGGTFEIPILTVNNKHSLAKNLLGNTEDAVGINSKIAERLSGADFDGDTVMVIPTNSKIRIKSTPQLEGLIGFDPKTEYGTTKDGDDYYNAYGKKIKVMNNTQNEMGRISNLITDMTLKGANVDELAAAVRHSMVVIDAEKHKLDYKQSYVDNNIESLKKKYQEGGASTLISRAKSEESVLKRQGSPIIDPETGKQTWKVADDLEYTVKKTNKKTGEVTYVTKQRTQPSTKMAETDDAYTLVSKANTPMEREYARYANAMKSLANQARKEMVTTGDIKYSASAKKVYEPEVKSLMAKLNDALKNAPRERQAQTIAKSVVDAKVKENPDMTKSEVKKASQQALTAARSSVGAKRTPVSITDREWEAIQSGAISPNKLSQILNNTDIDVIRQKATPRASSSLSDAKIRKIANMNASGYSTKEIADAMNISPSTVNNYLKGKE